jgi:signal peptide peptidase SppA
MKADFLASLFQDRVCLIDPSRAHAIGAMLLGVEAEFAKLAATAAQVTMAEPDKDTFWTDPSFGYLRPYNVSNGTLSIPVAGMLLSQFPYQAGRYATGYQYIDAAMQRGLSDSNVQRIALLVDSPGGLVEECFDCVDSIFAARGKKPTKAVVSQSGYSAAYAIASVADSISVSRTGGVGSVGVVTSHVDYSKALDQMGIKVTLISAPENGFKTEGSPYEPLSADARQRIQDDINEVYDLFVSAVVRNRGMSDKAVRGTKALTYSAKQAVEKGLADSVEAPKTAVLSFTEGKSTKQPGAVHMADIRKEDHDAAVSAARVEAGKAAAANERQRIAAITSSDAGKARPIAAQALAMDTELSAEAAVALLAKMPVEGEALKPIPAATVAVTAPAVTAPAATADDALRARATAAAAAAFDAAMNRTPNPNLHVAASTDGGGAAKADGTSELLGAYAAMSGYGLKPAPGARRN